LFLLLLLLSLLLSVLFGNRQHYNTSIHIRHGRFVEKIKGGEIMNGRTSIWDLSDDSQTIQRSEMAPPTRAKELSTTTTTTDSFDYNTRQTTSENSKSNGQR
jgi:hypothetical protein